QRRSAATDALSEAEALLERRAANLERAEDQLKAWKAAWSSAVVALGLPETATSGEAAAVLDVVRELSTTVAEANDLDGNIAQIECRMTQFADAVSDLLAGLVGHSDLVDTAPDLAAGALAGRLEAAQEVSIERQ